MFSREELIEIRKKALSEASVPYLDSSWARAYIALADATDRLDAMTARTQVAPPLTEVLVTVNEVNLNAGAPPESIDPNAYRAS